MEGNCSVCFSSGQVGKLFNLEKTSKQININYSMFRILFETCFMLGKSTRVPRSSWTRPNSNPHPRIDPG